MLLEFDRAQGLQALVGTYEWSASIPKQGLSNIYAFMIKVGLQFLIQVSIFQFQYTFNNLVFNLLIMMLYIGT